MDGWRRHAIYFAPAEGSALARFGSDWLGEGSFELPGLPVPRAALVAEPARYGFHATLKAPFRLAEGRGEAELDAAAAGVAAECARFELRLRVAALGAFLALVPEAVPPELAALEAACVTRLDGFRAPATAEELARRRAAGLDPEAEANLARWGYPWVLGRFRFHMTLTGPLAEGLRAEVRAVLARALAPVVAGPVPVAEICRFGEGADGRFRLVRRFPLGGSRAR